MYLRKSFLIFFSCLITVHVNAMHKTTVQPAKHVDGLWIEKKEDGDATILSINSGQIQITISKNKETKNLTGTYAIKEKVSIVNDCCMISGVVPRVLREFSVEEAKFKWDQYNKLYESN